MVTRLRKTFGFYGNVDKRELRKAYAQLEAEGKLARTELQV